MKTFSVSTTNVRLTGNIKIVVDTDDKLFVESINSTEQLSRTTYKGYEWSEQLSYGTNIRNFCSRFTNIDSIYDVKNEQNVSVTDKLSEQYHQLYHFGAYSEESQLVNENFRFFAPIHIGSDMTELPDKFIVLKMSGDKPANETDADWFNNGKLVHCFDLSKVKAKVFEQITDSYIDMSFVDTISVYGLNLRTGLPNREEENTFSELVSTEMSLTEVDNWFTNIYSRHKLVYSRLVNMEFAFTDSEIDTAFVRYAGFYVKSNATSKETIDSYEESGALRLVEVENKVATSYTNSTVLGSWNNIALSNRANGFAFTDKRALVEFTCKLNPQLGSIFKIQLDGLDEHVITFNASILGQTVEATLQNVVNDINRQYRGSSTSVKASFVDTYTIRLESNVTGINIGDLTIVTPNTFVVSKPVWSLASVTTNKFYGSNSKTLSLNTYISPDKYDKIMYYDRLGVRRFSSIVLVHKYKGDWFYELSEAIDHDNKPDTVWFVETVNDQPLICSVIDHYELDMTTETSQYSDVLDFDIDKYRDYLLSVVDDPTYQGSAVAYYEANDISEITEEQLIAYKALVTARITQFFESIDLRRDYLLKDINLDNFEATTCTNEYDRLSEREGLEFRKTNRLYQFISKWSYRLGTDVYNNDYRMSISLPFRFDNFAPSVKDINRDLRYHTHSWFIIGEGMPPYWSITDEVLKKLMSYTRYPVTEQLLASEDVDCFDDTMQWSTDTVTANAWSTIEYDKEQKICHTFFKGVNYRFDTSDLVGYRFVVVLKSSEQVIDDVLDLAFVKNVATKTLTLFIKFYIPDPILTTVERSSDNYYLDRALLYFSNEIYSTVQSAIDFGQDRISLKLYDNSIQKLYLNQPTGTSWFYTIPDSDTILYVHRGNTTIFSTSLSELLTVGQDFTIKFTTDDNVNSQWFGMTITFEEIVEVQPDFFWCKRIIVRHNDTIDPDTENDLDPGDNIVQNIYEYDVYAEYQANSNIFNDNNAIYISRAIAEENCFYQKILTSIANNSRYKELSLANVKNRLSSSPVKIWDADNAWISVTIQDPVEFRSVIQMQSIDNERRQLSNSYTYPMSRYAGQYVPQFRLLTSQYDTEDFHNLYPAKERQQLFHKMYTSNTSLASISELRHQTYVTKDFTSNDTSTWSYVTTSLRNEIVQESMSWIVCPLEFRGRKSLVFNSDEKLYVETLVSATTTSIDLVQLFKARALSWLKVAERLSDDDRLKIARLYANVTSLTIDAVNVEDIIVNEFLRNVLLKVYRIEKILTSDNRIVQFNITDTSIELVKEFELSDETLTITFTR